VPGGVFSSAGAGVKTNLVFFTKGKQTETIWYYDLSAVKVGKKTPLTEAHFEEFFKLLPARGDSPNAWTVNFAARLQQALEEARPHREKAAELFAQAKALEDDGREKRKAKVVNESKLAALEEKWRAVEREARESLAKSLTHQPRVGRAKKRSRTASQLSFEKGISDGLGRGEDFSKGASERRYWRFYSECHSESSLT